MVSRHIHAVRLIKLLPSHRLWGLHVSSLSPPPPLPLSLSLSLSICLSVCLSVSRAADVFNGVMAEGGVEGTERERMNE